MAGRLVSFWDDLFSGAMLVLGRVGFSSGVHEVRLFEFEQIIMKSGRFHPNTISRNPPVPANKQIAHHPGHSEESAYYPSFWKSAYYPSSKFQPEILQCS